MVGAKEFKESKLAALKQTVKQCKTDFVKIIEGQLDNGEDLDPSSLTILQTKMKEFEERIKVEHDAELSLKLQELQDKAKKLGEYMLQQQQQKQEFKDFNKWWEANRRIRPRKKQLK